MSALSNVLLINRDDLMQWTSNSGNLDFDKLNVHIPTATDIDIQPILGTKLLNKCRTIVKDNTIDDPVNAKYKILIEDYLTPSLVFYTMVDASPFLSYNVNNGGLNVYQPENASPAEETNMHMIIQQYKNKAQFYGLRMQDFLCDNQTDYPEFYQNTGSDMHGGNEQIFHGMEIGI